MNPWRTPILLALTILMGCSGSPPRRLFVLNTPSDAAPGVVDEAGRPTIELRPVLVPDYLDTTEILVREGRNELKPLTAGGWGERLSVGMTAALGAALSQRLPDLRVTLSAGRTPARQILIDVESFDIWPDGRCVLTAQWTILDKNRQTVGASQRGVFVAASVRSTDGAADAANIVSGMGRAIDQLAVGVAFSVRRMSSGR